MHTFYNKNIKVGSNTLDQEESKHAGLVLRLRAGDTIRIVDGLGLEAVGVIDEISKKGCSYTISQRKMHPEKPFRVHLAIAPTKNIDRMEWMVEKLGEIGVDELTPLFTKNSERSKLRLDRLEKKAISAMKQSGNARLMQLNVPVNFESLLSMNKSDQVFIAHVGPDLPYLPAVCSTGKSILILIGPEGDFTESEIKSATEAGAVAVSLGKAVLRTETAGLIGCQMINQVNTH